MGYAVELLDPRHDPEPGAWEPWRREAGLWANWAWPLVVAGAQAAPAPPLVAMIRRDSRLVGVVSATVAGLSVRRRQGWPRVGHLHVQAPQCSAQQGWWFDTDDRAERAELFRVFLRATRRELGAGVAGVLWRQLDQFEVSEIPGLLYLRPTEALAILDTPFDDLDGWLATLGSKRRRDLRRQGRLVDADADLVVAHGRVGDIVSPDELVTLLRANHTKHRGLTVDLAAGSRAIGWQQVVAKRDDASALSYRDGGGRLLAACLVLEHPRTPLWLSWGALPLEDGGRRHLYFDAIRRLVEVAVHDRAQAIVMGKGMAAMKADLGARLVPQFAAVGLARG